MFIEKDQSKSYHEVTSVGGSPFSSPIWRISWNFSGNLLAVGFTTVEGVNTVQVFTETEKDKWDVISDIKPE